ncbi:MAG: hypothetical protein H3C54_15100, partial [Taibaiella sp.]|nr:hypothetical protein [Taibaiella sp.]
YAYDAIGNLIQDTKEGITKISWTVYGKIESIEKSDGTTINYSYDAAGNRISKTVTKAGATNTTSYVRDAQGNVVSIYEQNSQVNSGHFTQSELHLYGSSRLGIYNVNKDLTITPPAATNLGSGNSGGFGIFERNKKFFELSNHLGNVLATVSDEKVGMDADNNGLIDYYTANIVSAQDYYPFGMSMPGRKFTSERYRYGFNGKENDKDISPGAQDYGMRINDNRLGRFLSVDPIAAKYPELTPYQFASNRPIDGVDMDGLEYVKRTHIVAGNGEVIHTEDYVYYKMKDNQLSAMGGTPAGRYNAGGHGPKGEGIQHLYINASGDIIKERWDLPRDNIIQSASTHGLYSGGGSITDANGAYDFSWQPIDIADAIAKAHDMDYAREAGDNQYQGYVEDVRTLAADRRMLYRIQAVQNGASARDLGLEAPYREDISGETIAAFVGQIKFIGILAEYKAWKVTQPNKGRGISILNEADANKFINSADGWKNRKIRALVTVPILQKAEKQRISN